MQRGEGDDGKVKRLRDVRRSGLKKEANLYMHEKNEEYRMDGNKGERVS